MHSYALTGIETVLISWNLSVLDQWGGRGSYIGKNVLLWKNPPTILNSSPGRDYRRQYNTEVEWFL